MKVETGDWLVITFRKKNVIAKAKDERVAILKDAHREKPMLLDITQTNLMANLGKKLLAHKSVYGASTNAIRNSVEVQGQQVDIYTKGVDEDRLVDLVDKAMTKYTKICSSIANINFEIYASKGNMKGQATVKKGQPIIRVFTDDGEWDEDTWLHEFGHILLDLCPEKVRASWIKAYQRLLRVKEAEPGIFKTCVKDLKENGPTFFKQLEPEYKDVATEIFKYIKAHYNLTPKELQVLYLSGEDLGQYIPSTVALTKWIDTDDKYSLKNVDEYFACSFSKYWMTKGKIREKELMKKTIEFARNNITVEREEDESEDR